MAKQRAGVCCPPLSVRHIHQIAQLPVVVWEPTPGSSGIDDVGPDKCYKSKPTNQPRNMICDTNKNSHQKQWYQPSKTGAPK